MEIFFVFLPMSIICVVSIFILCRQSTNEPTEKIKHIFNLSKHQSLNFGGVDLFWNNFQITPISNEEFGVVFSTKCKEEEFEKIIRSFCTNVKNFGGIKTENANFFILDEYLKSQFCPSFFYGESDGKAYTVCRFMDDDDYKLFVCVQICDLEKIQMALDEYNEVKKQETEQKERERQEKLKKEAEEAQVFPF